MPVNRKQFWIDLPVSTTSEVNDPFQIDPSNKTFFLLPQSQ